MIVCKHKHHRVFKQGKTGVWLCEKCKMVYTAEPQHTGEEHQITLTVIL